MCDTCGCNVTDGNRHLVEGDGKLARTESGREAVSVLQGLLSENDRLADHNRSHFDSHGVLALNLMSSPGSGKTRLLERTIAALGDRLRIAVVEGDLDYHRHILQSEFRFINPRAKKTCGCGESFEI